MAATLNINDLLTQVQQLDPKDQLTLLQKLAGLVKSNVSKKTSAVRLTSISGVGSELWKSESEIELYIDEERQW